MAGRPRPADATTAVGCVYCLHNGRFRDDQIFLRGEGAYACAPRGQLIEGFLAIATMECIGCVARVPPPLVGELLRLQQCVRTFYAAVYGSDAWTFYEQGRAGGGARVDAGGRFPLHAHVCSLPADVPIHGSLRDRYAAVPVRDIAEVATAANGRPYLYVETRAAAVVYVPRSPKHYAEIERARLKPVIARLLGLAERGDWRVFPGDEELARLTERWRTHRRT